LRPFPTSDVDNPVRADPARAVSWSCLDEEAPNAGRHPVKSVSLRTHSCPARTNLPPGAGPFALRTPPTSARKKYPVITHDGA